MIGCQSPPWWRNVQGPSGAPPVWPSRCFRSSEAGPARHLIGFQLRRKAVPFVGHVTELDA